MTKPVDAMQIKSIVISRGGQYSQSKDKPFTAEVQVVNEFTNSSLTIKVDEQHTLAMINIIADLIVQSVVAEMESFKQNALAVNTPALQIDAAPTPAPVDPYDDVPF